MGILVVLFFNHRLREHMFGGGREGHNLFGVLFPSVLPLGYLHTHEWRGVFSALDRYIFVSRIILDESMPYPKQLPPGMKSTSHGRDGGCLCSVYASCEVSWARFVFMKQQIESHVLGRNKYLSI